MTRGEIRHITLFLPVQGVKYSKAQRIQTAWGGGVKSNSSSHVPNAWFASVTSWGGKQWSDPDATLFSSSITLSEDSRSLNLNGFQFPCI